jgi:BlaI family penicillinase repressor
MSSRQSQIGQRNKVDVRHSSLRLGKVQLQIMQALWRRGRATAREITDELSRDAPIAHSTVQTLLRKLEAKGAVAHEVEDRTFVFRALHQQEEVATSAARDLLARVFHGSVSGLVAHLLRHEHISAEELQRLRELVEEETP